MALDAARYRTIDPQATGRAAVRTAFENQVAYCRDNEAPITALVCETLAGLIDGGRGGAVMERIRAWPGPPLADALPLRVAGGLHALHLAGAAPGLAPIYAGGAPADAAERIARALEAHEGFLLPWLDGPPQTNEAGRSWAFAAAMLWLVARGCPADFALFELGSSAGINLMMNRYRFVLGDVSVGPADSGMRIAPVWRGASPPDGAFGVAAAEGCDVAPVDLADPRQALRLSAYIWPDSPERFARMDAAIACAREEPPLIHHLNAGAFVEDILARPARPGVTRVIAHSVVWQYIPRDERRAITRAIEAAGEWADADAPLAWVSLEANRDTHRHELTLRWWPGGPQPVTLASAHPHGSWVEWCG